MKIKVGDFLYKEKNKNERLIYKIISIDDRRGISGEIIFSTYNGPLWIKGKVISSIQLKGNGYSFKIVKKLTKEEAILEIL